MSITTSTLLLENDIKLEKIERDAEPNKLHVNWVPLVLNAIGYNYIPYFCYSINKADQPDNVVVLIFAKKSGRSYAQPSNSNNVLNQRFLEGAVIYSEGFEGYELSDAIIVHEMLHLFGA